MYRVFIIILVMLLSGCGTGKGTSAEPERVRKAEASEAGKSNQNDVSPDMDTVDTTVPESVDNEFNRSAAEAYRDILLKNFPEGGYYCIVDINDDNVCEMAATARVPDGDGKYISLVAYINKSTNAAECLELKSDNEAGFDLGFGEETGKLLVRTGKDSVHHYAFRMIDGSMERSDFLVLDKIMESVDKTKDPDTYQKYISQDRGSFNRLLMWTITEDNLNRDLTGDVSATPGSFDSIDNYLRTQTKGKVYGFYNKEIEDVFSMDFTAIENRFGVPAARMLGCSVKKDKDSGNRYLNYEESFLWLGGGIGCYVQTDHTIEGTLDTFFDVRQDVYTFKELQDTLGVPFYHDSTTSDYDIVFVYKGHTFYMEASDMGKGLIERGCHVKALKNALDTTDYPLLFDPDGNITENNG
ncbi:hypothetical protein UYO_1958 [Lachnospiraceae bacterium JC7]|nr:hypothetical protein UYO_1958 [Lachnospiraceae bacterium JC7]